MEMSEEYSKWRGRIGDVVAARGGAFHRSLLTEQEQSELESTFRRREISADAFAREVGLKSHQLHNFLFCRRHGRERAKKRSKGIELRRVVVRPSIEKPSATAVRISTRGGCSVELPTVLDAAEFVRALERA